MAPQCTAGWAPAVHCGRGPAGHELVRVEQRHGLVADVAASDAAVRADVPADEGEALLRAERGLRLPCGARSEDQQVGGERVERDVRVGGAGVRRERRAPGGGVDHEAALGRDARVEPGEQAPVALLGHDHRAVGVADVALELGAAPGGVDADHGRPRERGGAEQERVLGHVVEQDAHVKGRAGRERAPQREQQGGALERGRDVRAPAPRRVLEAQRYRVVARALAQQVAHRPGRRRLGGRHGRNVPRSAPGRGAPL